MNKSQFFYDLPEKNIAQTPAEPRDNSKLMVYNKENNVLEEIIFKDIYKYFKKGDVLVLNDSKVLPARLYARRETGGEVEFLLLKEVSKNHWETLVKPGRKARVGHRFLFSEELLGEIVEQKDNGNRIIRFEFDENLNFYDILEELGEMPLPHYITKKLLEKDRYQTVYANILGSSAAPTAGLHFTKELLKKLEDMGVEVLMVTLHVGLGTFRPVKEDIISDHIMHSEHYYISDFVAASINKAKKEGRKIIGVGTTSCRTLESAADEEGIVHSGSRDTSIFITPGYSFKILDGLITNFHLPESTLIMLVCAFLGYDKTMSLYKYGVKNNYRFYSFGDAMMII